jgi:uncharacterized protein (TIGR03437 family)
MAIKRLATLTISIALFALAAMAQPQLNGATNTASFLHPALPNGGIAQGGMFTLFGINTGPTAVVTVSQFPLKLQLEGVSIAVEVDGTVVNAIPVVVSATQVSAILPSSTPTGAGTVILAFNGQQSNALAIEVVAHSLGIFAINQAGSGPGVFTDSNFSVNTIVSAASPGSSWDIWGTGIGAVTGDEAGGPLPGDLNLDVQVIVAGNPAQVVYRGRSGCCAGLDQIRFVIPAGVTGCHVPVVVIVNGVPSNTVSISIATTGHVCSNPGIITADELLQAQSQDGFAVGIIELSRWAIEFTLLGPAGTMTMTFDDGEAWFGRYSFRQLISTSYMGLIPHGSCKVVTFQGDDPDAAFAADPIQPQLLDAGLAIELARGQESRQVPRLPTGDYFAELGGGEPPELLPAFLEPGAYLVSNGAGGGDVGPFQGQHALAAGFVWTNRNQIVDIPSGQPLDLTWDGPNTGFVTVGGISIAFAAKVGAAFLCQVAAADKQFTVPSYVIDALPPSEFDNDGLPTGYLGVAHSETPSMFEAQGIDFGFVTNSVFLAKVIPVHTGTPALSLQQSVTVDSRSR